MERENTLNTTSQMEIVRYNGKWYKINPKPFESERQTCEIAWALIREPNITTEEAYRKWYEKERKKVKVLYPSFRKDDS
jgi:lipocalin